MAKIRAARKTIPATKPYSSNPPPRTTRASAAAAPTSNSRRSTASSSTVRNATRLELEEKAPKKDVFQQMSRFKAARVFGIDGTATDYTRSDDVYVAGPNAVVNPDDTEGELDEHQLWRARILQIRCPDPDNPANVWLEIAWYWTPAEFSKVVNKKFNPRLCGSKELVYVFGGRLDIINCASLNGVARVHLYEEMEHRRLLQITEKDYYYRTEYDCAKKKFKRQAEPSCLCNTQYIPDDDATMVFCPRGDCLTWYHTACLQKFDHFYQHLSATDLEVIREATQDGFSASADLYQQELEECWMQSTMQDLKPPDTNVELSSLHALARRPCMRGGDYGIVGNAGVILRARYLLDQVVGKNKKLPPAWRSFVWGEGGAWKIPKEKQMWQVGDDGEESLVSYKCPKCEEAL
ncbi:hypothetical protein CALCODRAFT_260690 [Calocera cornea HHB12733]|uniref:BAH domain-containing protein n=1 Tax=Calocera cornea HHB12733 TaxID=1353952 RepID=A0A165GIL7_9BASI|nr:hypothetical protein CALCODRAFT_260690 [Calocera cornea HHB12733]